MRQQEGGQQFPTDAFDSLFKAVRADGNAVFMSLSLERQPVLCLVGAMGTYILGLALVFAAILTVRCCLRNDEQGPVVVAEDLRPVDR